MSFTHRAVGARAQRGVALAMVVWFVAGMSLLVASIVLSARTDVRLAQLHLGRAQATAVGDGGITLLMADILDGQFAARGEGNAGSTALAQRRYQLGEHSVAVLAVPANWLVDLNTAPESLLLDAMQRSGTLGADDAKRLATAVVQWRSGTAGSGTGRFDATEDLLSVEGMNRASWDSIRDFVGVAQGRDALASLSPRARERLADLEQLRPIARALNGDGLAAPGSASGRSAARAYRVDALISLGDRTWLRRRWVSLSGSSGALPWRIERTEPARIVPRPRA